MTASSTLPHWDLTPFYPSLDSTEFERGFAEAITGIAGLVALFDEVSTGSADVVDALERFTDRYSSVTEQVDLVATYIHCFIAVDSRNTLAQAKMSEFDQHALALSQLSTRVTAWVGSLDLDAALAKSAKLREYDYLLRQMQVEARHLMTPAEENLAAELNLTGGDAWARLHGDVTSQIAVKVSLPSGDKELPMSAVRNLAFDKDREVRRAAYEAELSCWERNKVTIAAAMNSVKGQVNVLARRRGWESPLDESLFNNHIDRESLDAMIAAARESFPDFRRYLQTKARSFGTEKLAWYDLFAPVSARQSAEKVWEWDLAQSFIVEHFGSFSDTLSSYAARAFDERWIDAEPRSGKRGGAFCTGVRGDESRILANFEPSFNGMSTLAHELGHGYHNVCLSTKPVLLRSAPMTLAETASIFCETIIRRAGLAASSESEQYAILEGSLQGACQIVVDITSRYLFEQQVFNARVPRELSPDELNAAMLQAQNDTYGDGLDASLLHPYMWAVKPHYYSSRSFYNYPYMFGMLFGLGLYARYQADPAAFKQQYDDLLASTGCADASALAGRFGIDIRKQEFWNGSLDIVREDIRRFEELAARV